jgi:hypothetical protein
MVHPLSGPIAVEGVTPGDLLMVNILDLGRVPQGTGPVAGQRWGYTGIFARANGWGYLTDHFPDAYKAVWDFHCQAATSRHLPGVRFTGITHPGIIGTVLSRDLFAHWNTREAELIATAMSQAALHPNTTGTAHGFHAPRLTWKSPVKPEDPPGLWRHGTPEEVRARHWLRERPHVTRQRRFHRPSPGAPRTQVISGRRHRRPPPALPGSPQPPPRGQGTQMGV